MRTAGTVDVLAEPDEGDVDLLLVGIGSMAVTALAAAEKLAAEGVRVRVVDPVGRCRSATTSSPWPVRPGGVAVVEDNVVGAASAPRSSSPCATPAWTTPLDQLGIPKEFLDHGSRGQALDRAGLTPDAVAGRLRARLG